MSVPDLHILAQIFMERLLNTAVAGILLAGLVWALLRLIGRQNSGTRFAVWFSTLLAIVAFPFFSGSVLSGSLPSRSIFASSFSRFSRVLPAANQHHWIVLSSAFATYLFVAWGLGAALLLFRIGVGLWRMRDILGNCVDVDLSGIDPAIAAILQNRSLQRQVKLCTSSELAVPAAVGLFQPAIVFPARLWPQLSVDEIGMIVRHEFAHLCRRDDWTNLAQKIVRAVFFFHPAVWWIESRLTIEREMACDDIVLAQTASPRVYASSLISFAEKLHSARGLALAQALVSRMHQMSLRVAQILDAKRPSRTGLWKPALGLCAGLLAVVFGAVPYMPQFVAFEGQPQLKAADTQEASNAGFVPQNPGAVAGVPATPTLARQAVALQPKVIPATFHPDAKAAQKMKMPVKPKTLSKISSEPSIMRASATQEEPSMAMIYILRTTEYEVSSPDGPTIWTLCVWRIDEMNPAGKQLGSAIVVSWI